MRWRLLTPLFSKLSRVFRRRSNKAFSVLLAKQWGELLKHCIDQQVISTTAPPRHSEQFLRHVHHALVVCKGAHMSGGVELLVRHYLRNSP